MSDWNDCMFSKLLYGQTNVIKDLRTTISSLKKRLYIMEFYKRAVNRCSLFNNYITHYKIGYVVDATLPKTYNCDKICDKIFLK